MYFIHNTQNKIFGKRKRKSMSNPVLEKAVVNLDTEIAKLLEILPVIWSRESSGDPDGWTPQKPSYMQCYPTSRLVHTLFGGVIIAQALKPTFVRPGEPKFWSHCVNEIGGRRFDLTSAQLIGEEYSLHRESVWCDAERSYFDEHWSGMKEMILSLCVAYEQHSGIKVVAR
jgi:hypothetical protein